MGEENYEEKGFFKSEGCQATLQSRKSEGCYTAIYKTECLQHFLIDEIKHLMSKLKFSSNEDQILFGETIF